MEKFDFKKSLGQNFISDMNIINRIVDTGEIDKNTLVIEIGPGAGALSEEIVSRSKYTILYEIDSRLEKILADKLKKYNNYELIIKDVLSASINQDISKYDYDKLVVVANIPYYITTPIIDKLIKDVFPDRIVLMIQDEVADRITASPGSRNYGYMSVIVQSKYKAIKEFVVGKEYFTPVPKVNSAVIRLDKRDDLKINDYNYFVRFVGDCFRYKRKNIKNNLREYNVELISKVLEKNNLSITDRSEQVPVSVFIEIVNTLIENNLNT